MQPDIPKLGICSPVHKVEVAIDIGVVAHAPQFVGFEVVRHDTLSLGGEPQFGFGGVERRSTALYRGRAIERKAIGGAVVAVEALLGPHPDVAPLVLHDARHIHAPQRMRVVGIGLVNPETLAIEAVDAVLRPQPEEPARVLQHVVWRVLRQPIAHRQMLNLHRLGGKAATK